MSQPAGKRGRPSGATRLVRPHFLSLEPYEPIVPYEVLSQRLGLPPEKLIKLDGNENPYGPSPRVAAALARYQFYHIYPDPGSEALRQALEDYVGLGREHLVAGAGSDELIDLLLRLYLEPGDKVLNLVPTFGMYPFSAQVCGGRTADIPRREDFSVDVASVRKAVDGRTKLIFVASPNNPTGNLLSREELDGLLDTGLPVVVDEAYYEFSGETFAPLVSQQDNLMVLRTFSKWAGLAGLRVGYGIFPQDIAQLLLKMKPPYNVSSVAQVAALESLADRAYLLDRVRAIVEERERLRAGLEALGFVKPYPSQANFILCALGDGDARQVKAALGARGILVRHFDTPLLRTMLRISVGRPEHTGALLKALKEIGEEVHG